jgi:hypothetical protein
MEFPIVAGLILSLVVRYWPGQPAPQWINTWTDRLWTLLAVVFLAGTALSFYNVTSTVLPDGGTLYSTRRPQLIQYALIAICGAIVIVALVGTGYVARSVASAISPARAREAWRTATDSVNFVRLGVSLAVAAVALGVGLMLGGPLTGTMEGVSNIWPFVVQVVAAVVLFTALASAWSAAKGSPPKQ